MKRLFIFYLLLSLFTIDASSQKLNEMINLKHYHEQNKEMKNIDSTDKNIVFIGNSITEGWVRDRPQFFTDNNFIGRGISGQTSPQLLLRFRTDVIDLKPHAVIINVGTNDIAENSGVYNQDFTLGNIKSMTEIARVNNIQVILSSVLPTSGFPWNTSLVDVVEKVEALNKEIKAYARANDLIYIDYHPQLKDYKGGLKSKYSDDGVHPNVECYKVMEVIVQKAIGARDK